MEAILNIMKLVAIYMFLQGIPIYVVVCINQNTELFSIVFSSKIWKLIFTPYPYAMDSKLYPWLDTVVNPLNLVIMTWLFIRELVNFEQRVVDHLKENPGMNMFKCVRMKNTEVRTAQELKNHIDKVMLDGVGEDRELTLVKSCHMIEEHFEDFFNFNVLYNVMKEANLPKIVQDKISEKRMEHFEEVLKSKASMSIPEEENIANYAIVGFNTYAEARTFIQRVKKNCLKMKGSEFPELADVTAETAPDPYDIDWNHYSNKYLTSFHIVHLLLGILLFVLSPVADFYLEYTLSLKLASLLSEGSEGEVTKTLTFTVIKIIFSTIYTILCALLIRFYYITKPYKTHSARVDSKFYFYNFYCLINNLVADFYGILSAGIPGLKESDNHNILRDNSTYIFMTALKVSISLMISPYTVKLLDYIWKWANQIKFKIRTIKWPINYNRVISDIPIEHNFDFMATFVV